MSWTDNRSIEQILKLRDVFGIKNFIETGTCKGINAELYSNYFERLVTVDINTEFIDIAWLKFLRKSNIGVVHKESWNLLSLININNEYCKSECVLFYLDAHFYDPKLSQKDKWVVVKELKALAGYKNCIIVIHDFDCSGLGHLNYGGESLDWSVVGRYLEKVNPDFYYYVNTREFCDINTKTSIYYLPIIVDDGVVDAIEFVNSSDEKRYRGILYAVPKKLDLKNYDLVEFKHD